MSVSIVGLIGLLLGISPAHAGTQVCVTNELGQMICYDSVEITVTSIGSDDAESDSSDQETDIRFFYFPYPDEAPPGVVRPGTCTTNGVDVVCFVDPGPEAAEPDTASSYAIRYWQHIPLPAPQPYIAPGRAITGMFAYLETRGTTAHTYTEPNTPFGPLTVVATGKYYVDWGDGTQTGPHSREGGPWPDGQIKHEYINIGSYDVVVTERWTATWSFGDQSGTLSELRTVGRIDDFPVQQIQAVVLQ